MALTATAVPRVRDDIITSLELASPLVSVRLPHYHNVRDISQSHVHAESHCAAHQTGRIYASRLHVKRHCLRTSSRSLIGSSREIKAPRLCTCRPSRTVFKSRISWLSSSKSTELSAGFIMEACLQKVFISHHLLLVPMNSVDFSHGVHIGNLICDVQKGRRFITPSYLVQFELWFRR